MLKPGPWDTFTFFACDFCILNGMSSYRLQAFCCASTFVWDVSTLSVQSFAGCQFFLWRPHTKSPGRSAVIDVSSGVWASLIDVSQRCLGGVIDISQRCLCGVIDVSRGASAVKDVSRGASAAWLFVYKTSHFTYSTPYGSGSSDDVFIPDSVRIFFTSSNVVGLNTVSFSPSNLSVSISMTLASVSGIDCRSFSILSM